MTLAAIVRTPLLAGLRELDLALEASQLTALVAYLDLLARWNTAYNLTAVRDPLEMVYRHLLDSLAALPHVRGPRVLDVGSGAGLPGVPLAIACPQWSVTCLDSNGKKTRFITQTVLELGLPNVLVAHGRVEEYRPSAPFDTVTSRAFSQLGDFWAGANHLIGAPGRLVALKGTLTDNELATLPSGLQTQVMPVTVPGLEAQRHVVTLTRPA